MLVSMLSENKILEFSGSETFFPKFLQTQRLAMI